MMEKAMLSLSKTLFLTALAPLALSACADRTVTTTSEYSSISTRTDQALATSQQALAVAQQAEIDAKASQQQGSLTYQRSLAK
jgi:hypothetical protein